MKTTPLLFALALCAATGGAEGSGGAEGPPAAARSESSPQLPRAGGPCPQEGGPPADVALPRAGSPCPQEGRLARPPRILVANERFAADGRLESVTLAFDPSYSGRGLYRAKAESDCGADPAVWPPLERLRTIAPEATTADVSLPDGWGESVRAVRWFLFDEDVSPCYDWRVESVESDGIHPFLVFPGEQARFTPGMRFSADVQPLRDGAVWDAWLFGHAAGDSRCCLSMAKERIFWRYGTNSWSRTGDFSARCTVSNDASKLFLDGMRLEGFGNDDETLSSLKRSGTPGVFGCRSYNDVPWAQRVGGACKGPIRLFALSFREGDVPVRDFRPAVKNGEPGLWDAVGNEFCWNIAGTTNTAHYACERADGVTRFPLVAGRRIDAPEDFGERRLSAASETITTNNGQQ